MFLSLQKSRQSAYENEEDVSVRNNNNSGKSLLLTNTDPCAYLWPIILFHKNVKHFHPCGSNLFSTSPMRNNDKYRAGFFTQWFLLHMVIQLTSWKQYFTAKLFFVYQLLTLRCLELKNVFFSFQCYSTVYGFFPPKCKTLQLLLLAVQVFWNYWA